MKATIKISILSLVLFAQAAYSQQQHTPASAATSEQLKITHVSNRENFLENRIAALEYDTRQPQNLWICLYTLPQEGSVHDTVRITLGNRTVAVRAEVVTEQRFLHVADDSKNSSLDYTTAQSAYSAASTQPSAIQVNPDGTNSTIHYQGDTKLVVNPNGSQTVLPNDETSSVVGADGKQQMQKMNIATTPVVNPDGSHSTIYHSQPLATSADATRKKEKATLVSANYSRLHIRATPTLLKQIKQTNTLTCEVQLSSQTIELAMYERPLQRYQQKLTATDAGSKK